MPLVTRSGNQTVSQVFTNGTDYIVFRDAIVVVNGNDAFQASAINNSLANVSFTNLGTIATDVLVSDCLDGISDGRLPCGRCRQHHKGRAVCLFVQSENASTIVNRGDVIANDSAGFVRRRSDGVAGMFSLETMDP